MKLKEIPVQELQFNPMTMIAKEWMLLTAGNEERGYNTMTVSWGHLGSIWGHGGGLPSSVVFVISTMSSSCSTNISDTRTARVQISTVRLTSWGVKVTVFTNQPAKSCPTSTPKVIIPQPMPKTFTGDSR